MLRTVGEKARTIGVQCVCGCETVGGLQKTLGHVTQARSGEAGSAPSRDQLSELLTPVLRDHEAKGHDT